MAQQEDKPSQLYSSQPLQQSGVPFCIRLLACHLPPPTTTLTSETGKSAAKGQEHRHPISTAAPAPAAAAAAAAKSLQSCPTLCDPTDGSTPGFAVPGILQARTLEWVAISFSNA